MERKVPAMAKIDWGENLALKIAKLPESPGCYLMKDAEGTIIDALADFGRYYQGVAHHA
ncbi:MAG: hypothetical protein ACI4O7_04940 [Aristaeellaceae bacterium]